MYPDPVARVFHPRGYGFSDRTVNDSISASPSDSFRAFNRRHYADDGCGLRRGNGSQKSSDHHPRIGNSASFHPSVCFSAHTCGAGLDAGKSGSFCVAGPRHRDFLSGIFGRLPASPAGRTCQPGPRGTWRVRNGDPADAARQVAGESNLRCFAGLSCVILLAAAGHRRPVAGFAGDHAQEGTHGGIRSTF